MKKTLLVLPFLALLLGSCALTNLFGNSSGKPGVCGLPLNGPEDIVDVDWANLPPEADRECLGSLYGEYQRNHSDSPVCDLPLDLLDENGQIDWAKVDPDAIDNECLQSAYYEWAASNEPEGPRFLVSPIDDDLYAITGLEDPDNVPEVLEIPGRYQGKRIASVAKNAFAWNSHLKEVVLGEGIVSIDEEAFRNTSITKITFPSSMKTIGKYAFVVTSSLTEINLNVGLETIGDSAFTGCAFTELTIPVGLYEIGRMAFAENQVPARFIVKGMPERDGTAPFRGINASEFVFDCESESLPEDCFAEATIASLTWPQGLITIGGYAFQNVKGLGASFFASFPATVMSMGKYAFSGVDGKGAIMDLSHLTSLGAGAFHGATNLTLDFGAADIDLTSGGLQNFKGAIRFSEDNPSLSAYEGNVYTKDYSTILVAVDRPERLRLHPQCHVLGDRLYFGQLTEEDVTSLTIPAQIDTIGAECFRSNYRIQSLDLNNVVSIGRFAFHWNQALSSVTHRPGVLKTIGSEAFGICQISSFDFNGIQVIEGGAFSGNPFSSIALPSSVSTLGGGAFGGCGQLTSVDLSSTQITRLEGDTFRMCHSLSSVSLPRGLKTLDGAFYNTKITSLSLPSGLENLGQYALQDMTTGDLSHTSLKSIAGWGCLGSKASSFTLPSTVVSIGERAFAACTSLRKFTFLGTVAQWNAIAKGAAIFSESKNLSEIECLDGKVPVNGLN